MSLTLLGGAALAVAAAKSHETYLMGCDVLGAEIPEAPVYVKAATVPGPGMTYFSSVAAGLTVITIWTIVTTLSKKV